MYVDDYSISGEQVRAARALLRADQKQIALAAGLSLETIKRLEAVEGPINVTSRTMTALRSAFLKLGVVFDAREEAQLAVGWVRRDLAALPRPPVARLPRTPAPAPASLTRLVFWSRLRSDDGGPETVVPTALPVWLKKHLNAEVTGAELQHEGYLVQILEGPADVVAALYESALQDGEPDDTALIQSRPVAGRLFESWMRLDVDPALVRDIVLQDVGMADGFDPREMTPVAVLGFFNLLLMAH